jgi:hypothetical protein
LGCQQLAAFPLAKSTLANCRMPSNGHRRY